MRSLFFLISYALLALTYAETWAVAGRALASTGMSKQPNFAVTVDPGEQSICNFNPLLDTKTYYCGYLSTLRIPLYNNEYERGREFLDQEVTLKTSMVY